MKKPSWEVWSANVFHLLITYFNFTSEKAEELLYGKWTDCTYDMWKEDNSYEDAIKIIIDKEQIWNQ